MPNILTIDGPSASGKGTLAIIIAGLLNWHILPSGNIYRSLALNAIRNKIDSQDEERLVALILQTRLSFSLERRTLHTYLGQECIDNAITEDAIAKFASQIAVHSKIRRGLLAQQRACAQEPGLVAEGRDMGSVVFPQAQTKIFLSASVQERARRRCQQLQARSGNPVDEQQVLRDLELRDESDTQREISPLTQAKDAVAVETTHLSIDETVERIMDILRDRT